MIEETATVVARDGRYAWVESARKSACGQCSMNKGCGVGAISKVFGERRTRIQAINTVEAEVGESVMIGISETALLTGSFLVYLLPILSLLGFGLLGEAVARQGLSDDSEWPAILSGLFGLFIAMAWVRYKTGRSGESDRFQAVILRRLGRNDGCRSSDETKDD